MNEKHWALGALSDIRQALDPDRYDVAVHHISDAIAAIEARDDQGKSSDPDHAGDDPHPDKGPGSGEQDRTRRKLPRQA